MKIIIRGASVSLEPVYGKAGGIGMGRKEKGWKEESWRKACFYPTRDLPFRTVTQWSRPSMWSSSKYRHQEKLKSTRRRHCSLIPACPLFLCCIPHPGPGTPASNLSSSVSNSRKFGLLPPLSPALGRSPFMAPGTPSAHFLLEREAIPLSLK